jgi:1-acyl-sn-glycerol-3-phosphate acyltransferase
MWALAVTGLTMMVILWRWLRSGLAWRDFLGLGVANMYARLWHRGRSNGPAPFPAEGPALVISNHTCSADPMFLLSWSRRVVSFVVAREHYHLCRPIHRILAWLHCVPVTRGGLDVCAARNALRRLDEGRILCIFPEGNLSGVARNRLRPGKAGVALLALRRRVPVYPVYIAGGPRTEKLLRSWVYPSKVPVRVFYGPPIDLSAYHDRPLNRKTLEEVTAYLMQQVAALRPRFSNHKRGSHDCIQPRGIDSQTLCPL